MTLQVTPTAEAPIEGRPLVLRGRQYIVPPLSLFDVRHFGPSLKALDLSGGVDQEKLDLIAQIAHAAMKGNYPDMTLEEVQKLLDMGNVMRVFEAVMAVSGFEPAKDGDQPGESTGRS